MPKPKDTFQADLPDDYAKYLVHSPQEIAQVLRALQRQTELVTAYFNQGTDFFLTSVVDVDPNANNLILDFGSDPETNLRVLGSDKFVAVTSLDRIKIQFSTPAFVQIDYRGRPAFRTRVPKSLLKLQRREYYRLMTPMRAPLRCIVPDFNGMRLETGVVDISVGGVGISGFESGRPPEIGDMLKTTRISLPEEGEVVSTLLVRNLQKTTLRSGKPVVRAGCFFVDIPPPHQAMIQRYITRVDRERRALTRGS